MPRGKPLSKNEKKQILNLWVKGYTFRKIYGITNVSLSAIHSACKEAIEREPELEDLRRMSKTLQRRGVSFLQSLRGALLLQELNSKGVSLDELPPILELCEAVDSPSEAAKAGLKLMELRGKTGKSFEEILKEWAEKHAEIRGLEEKLKKTRWKLEETGGKLRNVEELESLQEQITNLSLTPSRLTKFVNKATILEENGFTLQTAAILSHELKKLGLNPAKVAGKLAELAAKHGNLTLSIKKIEKDLGDLKSDSEKLDKKINSQQEEINLNQEKLGGLRKELLKLEADYKKRESLLTRQIEYQKELIADLKKREEGIVMEIEALTGVKGTITEHLQFVEKLEYKEKNLGGKIKALTEEKEGIEKEIKLNRAHLEVSDAWRSYLLSGIIPSYNSQFWRDLNLLIQIGVEETRKPVPYLKPASESVRRNMIDLFKKMVEEDFADRWAYQLLKEKMEDCGEKLEKERARNKKAEMKVNSLRGDLTRQEENWEIRVMDEVNNRLTNRVKTLRCITCNYVFWIDKKAKSLYPSNRCPYCGLTLHVENLPYNIYHLLDQKCIIAHLPNQTQKTLTVVPSTKMVSIRTKDGTRHIQVPLPEYNNPKVVEQTYIGGTLKVTVEDADQKPT